MLSTCFNPECGKQLHYLRDGRVVRVIRKQEDRELLEHFWLCGQCCLGYVFQFEDDGTTSIIPRPSDRPVLDRGRARAA